MVDTDMLSTAFRSGPLKALPKLTAKDVSAAALYALATPPSVQVRVGVDELSGGSGWINVANSVVDWKFTSR